MVVAKEQSEMDAKVHDSGLVFPARNISKCPVPRAGERGRWA